MMLQMNMLCYLHFPVYYTHLTLPTTQNGDISGDEEKKTNTKVIDTKKREEKERDMIETGKEKLFRPAKNTKSLYQNIF